MILWCDGLINEEIVKKVMKKHNFGKLYKLCEIGYILRHDNLWKFFY